MSPLLATQGITAFYGDFQALFGVDIDIVEGETIAIIGANGAGKTTLLRAIAGLQRVRPEMVTFQGQPIGGSSPRRIVGLGIAMVPEGRKLFPSLSVEENLLIGKHRRAALGHWSLETVYRLFPILRERRNSAATALSGGQQQMAAIGRALMSNPCVLLCDEISLGLAPVVIRDIYAAFPTIKAQGASVVIVEQDIGQAMRVSNRVYCLQEGRVTLAGAPAGVTRDMIHAAYFGTWAT
jgi:branched-chain amino acid transport system ATP-binding protein